MSTIVPLLIVVGVPRAGEQQIGCAFTKSCAIGAGTMTAGSSRSNGMGI